MRGIALCSFLGVCALAFWTIQRSDLEPSTSALSLHLLELGVAVMPHDEGMRLRLAHKRWEAGQLDRARELVLREWRNPEDRAEADWLLIEIDFARLRAAPFGDRAERERRMADLHWTLESVLEQDVAQALLLRVGALYRELELPGQAASLFDQLARRTEQPDAERIELADASWLEAGLPLKAADLRAYWARHDSVHGASHARLALERARLAGGAPAALAPLLKQMRELYPRDIELLKLAFTLAEASDARRAYDLALELSRLQPSAALYHRDAARLAEASGRKQCALNQYMWLWRHEHRSEDKQRALRLARESADLQLLRELLDGTPAQEQAGRKGCRSSQRRAHAPHRARARHVCDSPDQPLWNADWDERYRLYEALGDADALRTLLAHIVSMPQGNTEYWWRRKLAFERRLDDYAAALQSLVHLLKFGPANRVREEIADLQLGMGDARAALRTLQFTPQEQHDNLLLRNMAVLAAAAGDLAAERQTYEEITGGETARLSDYQRLLALAPNEQQAARIAAEAALRFESFDMFSLAYSLHKRAGDESAQLELLKRVELLDGIASRVEYWQLRIALQQERALRAERDKNYSAAKVALASADDLLQYAAKTAPGKDQYADLWGAQHAQALSVGIASGDKTLALRAFLATRTTLNARERVYLLIKLGQPDQALEEAKRELGSTQLQDSDRTVLESDALNLTRGRATDLQLQGNTLTMLGLQALGASARIDYAAIPGGLRINVGYNEYQPVMSVSSVVMQPVRDLFGSLRGRLGRVALEVGANVRDSEQVRPFGMGLAQLLGDEERGASVQAQVNGPVTDNARLRVYGVADEVALKGVFGIGKYLWASARAAGDAYYKLADRYFLGYGANLDLGFGSSHELPARIGKLSVRVFGRGAPRFARRTAADAEPDVWLTDGFVWSGAGASIARGQLNAPLLFGRQMSYALDGAAGLVWPMNRVGWSASGQVGVSCFGADSLAFTAIASNLPGTTGIAGNLSYIVSFAD